MKAIYRGSTLARNMAKAGNAVSKGKQEAHHIVAKNAKDAKPARDILEKHGVQVDGAENGAAMGKAAHKGVHTKAYHESVNEQLKTADQKPNAKEAVVKTLNNIRDQLEKQ